MPLGRTLIYCVATVFILSSALAGCSNSAADSTRDKATETTAAEVVEEQPSTPEPVENPTTSDTAIDPIVSESDINSLEDTEDAVAEPEYDLVIEPSGEGSAQLLIVNALGLDITALSVKRTGEKEFGGVVDAAGLSWTDGQTALLKYDIPAAPAGAPEDAPTDAAVAGAQDDLCDIRLNLSDDSTITLHDTDLSPGTITVKRSDGVFFITYAGADGVEISSYEAEKALQDEEAAAKEKAEKEKKQTYKPKKKAKKKADDVCVDDIILG
jgi:hypothetical protein